ncbi:Utp12-domain-containing protein [Suhomyces tanzawaensis NRRL Y-17324]|uniref:Utp12-domain-containing protein n=1 Tax=Suhomyces tanzawaensis NRRL Y-17324 TaxID=984487 RepID=A0A1E4SN45_9ASCO|nr:Utp12-domain-containing protein [Suhomyces tanzawaensis NRRL Y-17324]ODV80949.1 Utp12-domain-containing protein [Suhomyces tanzawaensis NRRL Y-17324]
MVKSYDRYEQEKCFGVIASLSNIVWLPPSKTQNSKSAGRAISSGLEEMLIWDIKTGEIVSRIRDGLTPGASNASTSQAPSPITYLAHHEQSNLVAAGHADGSIKVWDITSSSVLINFQGHKSAISILKFDRSGTRLVSGSADSSIIMWDLVGEEGLFKLKGHKGQITGLTFLSEHETSEITDDLEDYILSVSKDGLIKLWELKSQQCVETHLAHSNDCWGMGINSSKDLVITNGNRDQVKVWLVDLSQPDQQKIQERGQFEKQSKSRCNEIEFRNLKTSSGTVQLFYLQNADRTIEIFRVRSEEEIKKGIAKRTKRLKEKGYEDDEILQSLTDSEISMMITPFTTLRTASKIKSCTWVQSSSKKLDLLVSLINNSIEYHNITVPELIKKAQPNEITSVKQHSIDLLGHRTDIRAMDLSSDNKLLATASNGELKIWNIKTTNVIRTFTLEGGYALCCKFLPGGTLVVVGFKNGDLELYDLATSSLVDRVEKAHDSGSSKDEDSGSAIWSLDLTPDGKTLVTGGNDKSVKFWNFKVEQELIPGSRTTVSRLTFVHNQTLELNEDVLCVKISPDAKYLAVSLLNNNVQVVFFDSLKLFLTLYGHKLPVLSIDISDDSKLIITSSADKNVKIWGLDFGDCHKSIFAHQDSIMNVRFIPESHNFFSSGKDGLIKYWDGDKFECVQKLPAHQSEVWCLCVSTDGSFMVSTSHDHSIRIWGASDDQVFLEEEREKEMDQLYEETLLESLEDDPRAQTVDDQNEDEDNDEATKVSKQTVESLKAGEKLMEAMDIGIEDVEANEVYEDHLKSYQEKKSSDAPIKPTPNAILMAFKMSGQEYVLSVVTKIRAAQLDDALLVLPFSYSLKLLRFIEIWTNSDNVTANVVYMSLICKILFFVVRSNARELVSQKDPKIKNQLLKVKEQLRGSLTKTADQLGVNTQGLKFVKQQWKLTHETEFIDEAEQREYEEKRAIKRTYTTV